MDENLCLINDHYMPMVDKAEIKFIVLRGYGMCLK